MNIHVEFCHVESAAMMVVTGGLRPQVKGLKKVMILGASGLLGRHVLQLAIKHPMISQIFAPTRKPLEANAKLVGPMTDSLETPLAQMPVWKVDAVICSLGTTIAKAGSREAFREVDYVLPRKFSMAAKMFGATAL